MMKKQKKSNFLKQMNNWKRIACARIYSGLILWVGSLVGWGPGARCQRSKLWQ